MPWIADTLWRAAKQLMPARDVARVKIYGQARSAQAKFLSDLCGLVDKAQIPALFGGASLEPWRYSLGCEVCSLPVIQYVYVKICICICIYLSIYLSIYIYIYIHIYVYIFIQIHLFMYIYIRIYICLCVCVCVCVCVFLCLCLDVCIG